MRPLVGRHVAPALALLLTGGLYGSETIYVDDDASPGGDGRSWETAYRFLQDALPGVPGDVTLRIAAGHYYPDRSEGTPEGTGDEDAVFALFGGVTLEGGYAGLGAEDPDDRDASTYETVFTGDLLGDDEPGFENMDDNTLTIVTNVAFNAAAWVLDGLTITASRDAGVGAYEEPFLHIRSCRFTGHRGFGVVVVSVTGSVADTVFAGNGDGEWSAGALSVFPRDMFLIDRCRFSDNAAFGGGALKIHEGSVEVRNSHFERNVSTGSKGNFSGGGAVVDDYSGARFTNCLFVDNVAANRGGAILFRELGRLVNCTFVGNEAPVGSVAFAEAANFDMSNCILWGNVGAPIVGDLDVVTWSIVEGGWPGEGNLEVDPQFVDPPTGDYRLAQGSPCIDAANNDAVPEGITDDLNGNPRFVDDPCTLDTGNGEAPIVDMGAYEFQPPCPADLDCSGAVDFGDILAVLAAWGPYEPCPPAIPEDIDHDCQVGFSDILLVLGAWGPCE